MIGRVLGHGDLTDAQRDSLEGIVKTWLSQRRGRLAAEPESWGDGPASESAGSRAAVEIETVEFLGEAPPTSPLLLDEDAPPPPIPAHRLVDIIARIDDRIAHVVVGLRRPGEEPHLMRPGDDPVLGIFDHDGTLSVAVDAVRDADLASLVLHALLGTEEANEPPPSLVTDDDREAEITFADRCTLTVYPWPGDDPHPAVALLAALDEAGFNHVAAPLALWRREGRDLGVVQEQLSGSADGWALALTSLRDLYGAGGLPEEAGGDFASEAKALGTMTARMHLALDKAFGRSSGSIRDWVQTAGDAVRAGSSLLDDADRTREAVEDLETTDLRAPTIRTHGDFHLGRTARTDQGWVVTDCAPGGVVPGTSRPEPRSPLGDVADMLWSLHHVAAVAASERDPSGRGGLAPLAHAWETRNRRAFLAGYLATPGIGGLVPSDREVVRKLAAVFELERATSLGIVLPPAP